MGEDERITRVGTRSVRHIGRVPDVVPRRLASLVFACPVRLGRGSCWVELEIVGYESGLLFDTEDDLYDLETEWLELRADVVSGVDRHFYGGISLDVEDCVRLTRWLNEVATSRAAPSLPGEIDQITFAEPDMAIQALPRDDNHIVIRWFFYDKNADVVTIPDYSGVPARTVDALASLVEVGEATQSLVGALGLLLVGRSAAVRAAGSRVGPNPLDNDQR